MWAQKSQEPPALYLWQWQDPLGSGPEATPPPPIPVAAAPAPPVSKAAPPASSTSLASSRATSVLLAALPASSAPTALPLENKEC